MSKRNYLVAPKLHNLGFIPPNAADLRIKQGLAPQTITNTCVYEAPKASAYPTQGMPKGAFYNQKDMRDYCCLVLSSVV